MGWEKPQEAEEAAPSKSKAIVTRIDSTQPYNEQKRQNKQDSRIPEMGPTGRVENWGLFPPGLDATMPK